MPQTQQLLTGIHPATWLYPFEDQQPGLPGKSQLPLPVPRLQAQPRVSWELEGETQVGGEAGFSK